MTDFLNNPEENIAAFGSSLKDKLEKKTPLKEKEVPVHSREVLSQQKKNRTVASKASAGDDSNKMTVHIRISNGVDLAVREALLAYYKSTGKKISVREYADRALMEYLNELMLK